MSSTSTDRQQDWKFRTTIGFYLISIALTTLGVVNLIEYRNEVKALKEARDHDYREQVAWTTTGWVSRSRKQDSNLTAYQQRIAAFFDYYERQGRCGIPEHLAQPLNIVPVESTEALIMQSQNAPAPYGTGNQSH
jgi:hypothetical protein